MDNYASNRLMVLAHQLHFYKPPSPSPCEIEGKTLQETATKDVSQLGFQESVPKDSQRSSRKRAAFLVCIFEGDDGELHVILTKRSFRLYTHSCEVSFPGGKAEEGDKDDVETGTREAKEEIGLDPSLVHVVTVLEPFFNMHLVRVIPVIEAFRATPNPTEVEAVFDVPLEMFIKDENRRAEGREWLGEKYLVHFFDYVTEKEKHVIWGLTAGILIRAASVVYQRPPTFVEQNPKFNQQLFWSRIQSSNFIKE